MYQARMMRSEEGALAMAAYCGVSERDGEVLVGEEKRRG